MKSITYIFSVFLLMLFASVISARTVYLKNGTHVVGEIVSQNRTQMTLNVKGKTVILNKSDIDRIDFRDKPEPVIEKQPQIEPEKVPEKKPEKIPEKKPEPVTEQPDDQERWKFLKWEFKENRWTIAARSVLVPGWGQWRSGEKWTGASYFTSSVIAVGGITTYYLARQKSESSYQNATLNILAMSYLGFSSGSSATQSLLFNKVMTDQAYDKFNSDTSHANDYLRGFALIYGGQLFHSYWSGTKFERNKKAGAAYRPGSLQKISFSPYLIPENKYTGSQAGLTLNMSF